MADIQVTCPACGQSTPVSEYAASDTVPCHACRHPVPIPRQRKAADGKLKLRPPADTQYTPATAVASRPLTSGAPSRRMAAGIRNDLRRVRTSRLLRALAWLVFVALAAALGYLRFYSGLPAATLKTAGLAVLGLAYLACIGVALKDNMFDGLLAIVVPFYPFYFILCVSGSLFLRAVVAACLVAFGYDLGLWLHHGWLRVFDAVNYWIRNV